MGEKIYIRCQASQKRGFAHLRRCLIIGHATKEQGAVPVFIQAEQDKQAIDFIKREGFETASLPQSTLANEAAFYPAGIKNILLDLVHAETLKDPLTLTNLLHDLIDRNIRIAFIDAIFQEAFRPPSMPHVECIVAPYVGAEEDVSTKCNSFLGGAQYAILGPQYKNLPTRQIVPKAKNILIAFGGADPQGLTAKVLEYLPADVSVRAIIGPYFSEEHKAAIRKVKTAQTTFVEDEMDLLSHYLWADICITGSGTSRYECAATGLPVIFTSLYDYHEQVSRIYAEKGLGVYVGRYETLTATDWQNAVKSLMENHELRADLSAQSNKNIDSQGTDRIVSHLIKTVF